MGRTKKVKRAYRYRFYPTAEQADELNRTFGCVRKAYNLALEVRTQAWREGRRVSYAETSALLTTWKRTEEFGFLAEVSSVPLQQTPLPDSAQPSTVTVSRDPAGRWHVSILVETTVRGLPPAGATIGVDAGVTSLLTLSTGEKIANPKYEKRDRARLARAQRNLSRTVKDSKNQAKAQLKVARVHARIADRRRDFLHKLATRLVRENQTVVVEDLAVRNMVRNHALARSISDAAWGELRRQLEYKADWHGREIITVDRFFPSSQTCSGCGNVDGKKPLGIRAWTCRHCRVTHDRDVNAAKNILAAGLAVAACGDGVRPNQR